MKAILCFGDSITFGRGGSTNKGWVFRLDEYFSSKDYYNAVYNLGIPGGGVDGLLKRIKVECDARVLKNRESDKFLILLSIGLNDSRLIGDDKKEQISLEDFQGKISEVLNILRQYSAEIVMLGLTPIDESRTQPYEETWFTNERINEFNELVKVESEKANVIFLDLFSRLHDDIWPKMLGDGVHPNDQGYDKMFEIIKDFLTGKGIID